MPHKRTALPQTEGLFIGAFERLHPEYQNIQLGLVRIDTFGSSFPHDPHRYRVIAATNPRLIGRDLDGSGLPVQLKAMRSAISNPFSISGCRDKSDKVTTGMPAIHEPARGPGVLVMAGLDGVDEHYFWVLNSANEGRQQRGN